MPKYKDSPFKTARNTTRSFYSYYLIYTKGVYKAKKRTLHDPVWVKKILSCFLKVVREHYLYNEGGVYLKKLGYFCTSIDPGKGQRFLISGPSRLSDDRSSTNGYFYHHFVYPEKNESYVLSLNEGVIREKRRLMKLGVRYKFLYREVKQKQAIDKVKRDKDLKLYERLDLDKILKYLTYLE